MPDDRHVLAQSARIGFVISHPFHFTIYKPLIRALKNPLVVVEKRPSSPFDFSEPFLKSLECEHVIVDENDLGSVDKLVDCLFVMTPKHLDGGFRRARTIAMQYGMAKEYYNYGLWRCRADLNMMYGPYSTQQVAGHAVARSVGNVRLDGYIPPRIGGGGLLYLPTYGTLSTLPRFVSLIDRLDPAISIKVKLHHASEFEDAEIIRKLMESGRVTVLDGYRDALDDICEADVVLSDYSGAIFDAFFLDRPVALFQPGYKQKVKRTDDRSIEIARGHDFGEVLGSEDALISYVHSLAQGRAPTPARARKEDFLSNQGSAVPVALDLIEQVLSGEIAPSLVQESIRASYSGLKAKRKKASAQKSGMRSILKVLGFAKK